MLARSVYARLRPGKKSLESARHIRFTWSVEHRVAVDLAMLVDDLLDEAAEVGAQEILEIRRVVEGVAAAESLFLRELCKCQETLGPPGVAQPASAGGDRKSVHPSFEAGPQGLRNLLVAGGHHACQVLSVSTEKLVGSHARQQHLDTGGRWLPRT